MRIFLFDYFEYNHVLNNAMLLQSLFKLKWKKVKSHYETSIWWPTDRNSKTNTIRQITLTNLISSKKCNKVFLTSLSGIVISRKKASRSFAQSAEKRENHYDQKISWNQLLSNFST